MPENMTRSKVQVFNCVFRNNSANAESSFQTSNQVIGTRSYTGRGGSMAVFNNASHHNISLTITNSLFENSFSRSHGGGLYIVMAEKYYSGYFHNEILIERTIFNSNVAVLGGGGLVSFSSTMVIIDCIITNNSAIAGGGIFLSAPVERK